MYLNESNSIDKMRQRSITLKKFGSLFKTSFPTTPLNDFLFTEEKEILYFSMVYRMLTQSRLDLPDAASGEVLSKVFVINFFSRSSSTYRENPYHGAA